MKMQWRAYGARVVGGLLLLSFILTLALLFKERAGYINSVYGRDINCDGCLTRSVFLHDLIYFSGLLLLLVGSFCTRRRLISIPLRILALTGAVIYGSDIQVLSQFSTRLKVADVRVYGEQVGLLWRHLEGVGWTHWTHFALVAVIIAWLVTLVAFRQSEWVTRYIGRPALALPLIGFLVAAFVRPEPFVHEWVLLNVAESNLAPGNSVAYSEAYSTQLLEAYAKTRAPQCTKGADEKPNIILLILESWSPYQSRLFSGINDWTPKLDALAKDHTYYSEVYAGGYTTNMGLISLLTGLEYIAPTSVKIPFESAWNTDDSLPRVLAANGYYTSFLTTGNLAFSWKGQWLEHIGFAHIEGHDHPDYEGHRRRHFDSVADEFLYARALKHFSEELPENQPYFVTIENVSTHHPYVQPRTLEETPEAVFRYMDDTVTDFYNGLESSGFFESGGLLIMISDHRAMVPVMKEELELFGHAAVSRIPAIVIGGGLPKRGRVEQRFHQSDLLQSLARLTGAEVCHDGVARDLFAPEETHERCLFHARGDVRDHIDVFCPKGSAVVELRGDDTRVLSSRELSKEERSRLVEEINTYRLLGQERGRIETSAR